MRLIAAGASPFVRKVRVVLAETEQEGDVHVDFTKVTPVSVNDDLNAANPLGKIPALVREDGPAIYDSRVICRYLNDRALGALYPKAREWEVLTLEATGDAIMEAAVAMVYERHVRPEDEQSDTWVEAQWTKIDRTLDALEAKWMSHLSGPLDISHISIGCALGYIDFRLGDRNWRKGRAGLAAWEAGFLERPSMQATIPSD